MLAQPFASTTAGWIFSLVIPGLIIIVSGMIGYVLRSIKAKFDKLDNKVDRLVTSQTLNNQTLAILTHDSPKIEEEIEKHDKQLGALDRSVAVLENTVKEHLSWHNRQHSAFQPPIPGVN